MNVIKVLKPYLSISKDKSKDSLISLPHKFTVLTLSVFLSTMVLTGCDESKNSESSATESSDSAVEATAENTLETPQSDSENLADNHEETSHKDDSTEKSDVHDEDMKSKYTIGDGQATADMMAVSLFYPIQMMYSINDSKLTPDNVKCIQQIDYSKSATTYQKFLKDKFSADEISQLDSFYATELGDNLTNVANQQINKMAAVANVKGSVVSAPNPKEEGQLTPEDQLALIAFNQTEVGSKLGKQIMNEVYMNDGLINYTLPALGKELEACNLTAPTKQEMDSWSILKEKKVEIVQ